MSDHQRTDIVAISRLLWTWFLVGASQMTPLQWVQFVAGILAIVYTVAQLFYLLRDRWRAHGGKP